MRYSRFFCAVVTGLLLGPVLFQLPVSGAEISAKLSLEQAIALGLQRNLGLQANGENIVQAEAGEQVAVADFDPTLKVGLGLGAERKPVASQFVGTSALQERTTQGEVGVEKRFTSGLSVDLNLSSRRLTTNDNFAGLDPEYRTSLVLTVTQPLLRDFGRKINRTGIEQNRLFVKQALRDYQRQGQLLAAKIETAYIDLAQALSLVQHRRDSLDLALELLDGNQRKLALGQVPKSDVQQAETSVESRREQLILAQQQFENYREQLLELLDLDPDAVLEMTPLAPPASARFALEQALETAHRQRPDLEQAAIDQQLVETDLRFRKNQLLPRLDLQIKAGLNGLSGSEQNGLNSSYRGGWADSFGSAFDRDGYQWQAGLALRYPLGNKAARARLVLAKSQRRQSRQSYQRLLRQVTSEVRNAWTARQRSLERIAVAERYVALAEKTLNQEGKRVKVGLSDSFRLLIVQDSLVDARIRLDQARGDARRGQALLDLSMGTNLQQRGIALRLPRKES